MHLMKIIKTLKTIKIVVNILSKIPVSKKSAKIVMREEIEKRLIKKYRG